MAQKRMFSKKITDSDKFLDLPLTAQALYFHLNMHADDDGFIDSTKTIKRMIGASDGDLRMLFEQAFVIPFESGVVVIKDWKIHNYIPKDRYQQTVYTAEFSRLELAENNSYTNCIQNASNSYTQIRLDKSRLDKIREDEDRVDTPSLIIAQHCQSHGLFVDGHQLQMLEDFYAVDGMHLDVICRAVTEAADNGKRNLKYILAILRSWKADGIMTLAQVEDRERQRMEQKNKSFQNGNSSSQTNVPDWSKEEYRTEATPEELKQLEALRKRMTGEE